MSNKKLFKVKEGDKYFLRNINFLNLKNYEDDKLQKTISNRLLKLKNKKIKVLEIGCGDGKRLTFLKKKI